MDSAYYPDNTVHATADMNKMLGLSDDNFYGAIKELVTGYDDVAIAWYSIKFSQKFVVRNFIVQVDEDKYFSESYLSYRYDDTRRFTIYTEDGEKKVDICFSVVTKYGSISIVLKNAYNGWQIRKFKFDNQGLRRTTLCRKFSLYELMILL